jgi:RNA polymerase sigma-70 factor, ECF subfamily
MGGSDAAVSSLGQATRRRRRVLVCWLMVVKARLLTDFTAWPLQFGEQNAASRQTSQTASQARHTHFERLFAHYQLPLLDYLYGMTRDRELAADLVQDTFLRAFASSPEATDITYPQAWLYRIATNLALSALRRRKRFGWLGLYAVEPGLHASSSDAWRVPQEVAYLRADDFTATVVERDAVWQVLAELPPRWRAVLLLQTTAGFRVAEIAAQLNLSEANVRKLLFRAKERFREIHARIETLGGPR